MNLAQTVNQIESLLDAREILKKDFDSAIEKNQKEIAFYLDQKRMILEGISVDKIYSAREILSIKGKIDLHHGDDVSAVKSAIKFIASLNSENFFSHNTYQSLFYTAFGTKDYDSFYRQRSDNLYGWRPKHGSIVFAVEIKKEWREFHSIDEDGYSTRIEKKIQEFLDRQDDLIYYLEMVLLGKAS